MKPQTKRLWVDRATMAIAIAGLLWVVAGYVSLGVLAHAAPLSEADLKAASWLSSQTTALHFTTGPMAKFVVCAFLGIALLALLFLRNPVPLIGAFAASACICALNEEAAMRVGVLDGVVRIGCYVPGSAECLKQAGLPAESAPSIYEAPGGLKAAWYQQERRKVVSSQQEVLAGWHSVPGGALLRAPLHLTSGELLKDLLATQRKELDAFKAAALRGKT